VRRASGSPPGKDCGWVFYSQSAEWKEVPRLPSWEGKGGGLIKEEEVRSDKIQLILA